MAFSRKNPENKVYVQHLLSDEKTAQALWEMLVQKGAVYICGDAVRMAPAVEQATQAAVLQ